MDNIMDNITYRIADVQDAPALLEIYAPYIRETAVTFEYDVPSVEEFAGRIAATLKRYPYIAALEGGRIVGYAYASPYHPRAALAWTAETSIYLDRNSRRKGIGRGLYEHLEAILKKQNILNLYASIAYTEAEDEYLTNASMTFHEHLGYKLNGRFNKCGYKFGRWYDLIWMEKFIGTHEPDTRPVVPFSTLNDVL